MMSDATALPRVAPVTMAFQTDPAFRELVDVLDKYGAQIIRDDGYATIRRSNWSNVHGRGAIVLMMLRVGLGRVAQILKDAYDRAQSASAAARDVTAHLRTVSDTQRVLASTFPEGSAAYEYVADLVLRLTAPSSHNRTIFDKEYNRKILELGFDAKTLREAILVTERQADAFAAAMGAVRRVPGLSI